MDWVIEPPSVALDLSTYQDFQEMGPGHLIKQVFKMEILLI